MQLMILRMWVIVIVPEKWWTSTMLERLILQPSPRRLHTSLQSSLITTRTRHPSSSLNSSNSLFPLQSWVWLLASAFTPNQPKAGLWWHNLYLDCLAIKEREFVIWLCCCCNGTCASPVILSSKLLSSATYLFGYLWSIIDIWYTI